MRRRPMKAIARDSEWKFELGNLNDRGCSTVGTAGLPVECFQRENIGYEHRFLPRRTRQHGDAARPNHAAFCNGPYSSSRENFDHESVHIARNVQMIA